LKKTQNKSKALLSCHVGIGTSKENFYQTPPPLQTAKPPSSSVAMNWRNPWVNNHRFLKSLQGENNKENPFQLT